MKKIFYLFLIGIMVLIPKNVFAYDIQFKTYYAVLYDNATQLQQIFKTDGVFNFEHTGTFEKPGQYSNHIVLQLDASSFNSLNANSKFSIKGNFRFSQIPHGYFVGLDNSVTTSQYMNYVIQSVSVGFIDNYSNYNSVSCDFNPTDAENYHQSGFNFRCDGVKLNTSAIAIDIFYNSLEANWIGINTILDIAEEGSNEAIIQGIDDMKKEQEKTNEKLDETNKQLEETNDYIKDDTPPDADISSLGNVQGLLPPGPVDSLLNIPFYFLSIVTSSFGGVCTPITGNFVFDTQLSIPCFSELIYNDIPDGIMIFINLIPTTFLLIVYFKHLYKKVSRAVSLETTGDDEWGVL